MWKSTKLTGGLREIITRATCAKGQKRLRQVHTIVTSNRPEDVLGYRITAHSYVATPKRNAVEIKGEYDIHLWYSYDDGTQTAVERRTVKYCEHLPVIDLEGQRLGVDETVTLTVRRQPVVVGVLVKRGAIEVEVELEVYAEIIGETKLWVRVYEPPFMDDDKAKAKDYAELEEDDEYFDEDDFVDEDEDLDDDDIEP